MVCEAELPVETMFSDANTADGANTPMHKTAC